MSTKNSTVTKVTGKSSFEKREIKVDESKVKKSKGVVTINDYFKVPEGTYEFLKFNIENGINTMLIGPTGTGKTEIVANLASVMGLPITVFDMGTMTDPIMGLVGTHVITVKDGVTHSEFKASRFSDVIQQPGIVLLDELSRAGAQANNLLFPCLDFRRELPMEYAFDDTTPIQIHPQCVFFATANIGSQYTGTHKLDRALLDRFMTVEVDSLKKEDIIETLKSSFPSLSDKEVSKMVDVFNDINKEHDEFKISFNMSLRHLKTIGQLVSEGGFTLYDSFYIICKGLGSKEGIESIKSLLETTQDIDE